MKAYITMIGGEPCAIHTSLFTAIYSCIPEIIKSVDILEVEINPHDSIEYKTTASIIQQPYRNIE